MFVLWTKAFSSFECLPKKIYSKLSVCKQVGRWIFHIYSISPTLISICLIDLHVHYLFDSFDSWNRKLITVLGTVTKLEAVGMISGLAKEILLVGNF